MDAEVIWLCFLLIPIVLGPAIWFVCRACKYVVKNRMIENPSITIWGIRTSKAPYDKWGNKRDCGISKYIMKCGACGFESDKDWDFKVRDYALSHKCPTLDDYYDTLPKWEDSR